jgi:hypothetical protein
MMLGPIFPKKPPGHPLHSVTTATHLAKAVEVVEKAMTNDHLMSQPIVDPQYPHFIDKKIMTLRQSGNLNEGILKVFPSLKPPMFPSKSVKWETEPIFNEFDLRGVFKTE